MVKPDVDGYTKTRNQWKIHRGVFLTFNQLNIVLTLEFSPKKFSVSDAATQVTYVSLFSILHL